MRPDTMLLRDFVQHALYARAGAQNVAGAGGYFSKHVVGGLRESLSFRTLSGEGEYRQQVAAAAEIGDRGGAWLTPSEVFTPFYGSAVARSIVHRHRCLYPKEPLQIVEVGGGNGTFATDFLGCLRREEPDLFASCKYVLVEISERLAEVQRATLTAAGFACDADAAPSVHVQQQCAFAWAEEQRGLNHMASGPWHFAMMEVLDNLPHDKLRVSTQPDGSTLVEEALVLSDRKAIQHADGRAFPYREVYQPLSDADTIELVELLGLGSVDALRALEREVVATEGATPGAAIATGLQGWLRDALGGVDETPSAEVYMPTGSWRLLKRLCQLCPEHQFTLADFSWLPPQPDGAINAPVVQTQRHGQTLDLEGDYLRAPGVCDILFPTHFEHLAIMVQAASARIKGGTGGSVSAASFSTADFMREWHDMESTATRSGFNPMLEDFTNTRFLCTSSARRP